jgi:hypothetical protein
MRWLVIVLSTIGGFVVLYVAVAFGVGMIMQNEVPAGSRADSPASPKDFPVAPVRLKTEADESAARYLAGTATDDELRTAVSQAADNHIITYAHLKKNADRYRGEVWRFRGRIAEISEGAAGTVARITVDDDAVMWVEAAFQTDFVEGNRVDVLGMLVGSKSYTSQAGWNITIPALTAFAIEKPGAIEKRLGIRRADGRNPFPPGIEYLGESPGDSEPHPPDHR